MKHDNPAGLEALRALQRRGATVERLTGMLAKARMRRERDIRAALKAGVPAAVVARAARLTPGRVFQLIAGGTTEADDDGGQNDR